MARISSKKAELTSKNLQEALWETLRAIKSKKMKPADANAIASQAREICRVSKLNIEYMKITGKKPSNTSGLLTIA